MAAPTPVREATVPRKRGRLRFALGTNGMREGPSVGRKKRTLKNALCAAGLSHPSLSTVSDNPCNA